MKKNYKFIVCILLLILAVMLCSCNGKTLSYDRLVKKAQKNGYVVTEFNEAEITERKTEIYDSYKNRFDNDEMKMDWWPDISSSEEITLTKILLIYNEDKKELLYVFWTKDESSANICFLAIHNLLTNPTCLIDGENNSYYCAIGTPAIHDILIGS